MTNVEIAMPGLKEAIAAALAVKPYPVSGRCAVCGAAVEMLSQEFFEGLCHKSRPRNYRPIREWSYAAALYHHPETHESYCSPQCATAALTNAAKSPSQGSIGEASA